MRRFLSLLAFLSFCLGAVRAWGQAYGLDTAPAFNAYLNGVFPTRAPSSNTTFATAVAFPNLTVPEPIFLTPYPNSNFLAIVTKPGRIYRFDNNPAVTNAGLQTFLDISSQVFTSSDCGMTGLVFHPQFGQAGSPNRGFIYVTYKWRPNPDSGANGNFGYIRLSRFTVPDGQNAASAASEVVLLQEFDRQQFHDAGCLVFGGDGYLYFSIGDEGGGNDEYNVTQQLNARLHSGIFRIDVDQVAARSHAIRRQPASHPELPAGWPASFSANYLVPNDNPFVNPDGSVLEEYYALGFRQPYRFSRDPVTGTFWVGESGQSTREEIDILQAGANYGWAFREGTVAGPKAAPATLSGTLKEPLWDYGRDQGGCVIGGYVYRGTALAPELVGKYIFADNVSGRIFAITASGETLQSVEYLASMPAGSVYAGTSSCGLDANGEIYFLKFDDAKIYHLVRQTAGVPEPPARLSQTGAFSNLATLTPSSGFIPYNVNAPLWSDNAAKKRWLAVPNDGTPNTAQERITFAADSEWQFPSGTVFIKQFDLPIDDTNPALTRRLETRFIVIDENGGSYGVTYRWRADGSDADLLTTGASQAYSIATGGGGTRSQTWSFPSRTDCTSCHNPNAKHVLGVKTHQLNGSLLYPATGRTDNQLRTLAHIGLLAGGGFSEAQIPAYLKSHALSEAGASLEIRARSYLDASCAHCHRPGGVRASFDARFPTPLAQQNLIYGQPFDTINGASDRYVRPQDLTHSLTYERASRVGALQMPPLAKNVADSSALQVLGAWISSLNPAPAVVLSRTPATGSALTAGPFSIQAQFTENIGGINAAMFALENAAVTGISGSGTLFQATVQPQLEGAVAVQFAGGRVAGAGGFGNYASNVLDLTYDALTAGLGTWLRFNEGSGSVAEDSSGLGNPGTLLNFSGTPWIAGVSGSALRFDGVDDYVSIANRSTLDFTLACWLRTTQTFPTSANTYAGNGIIWSDIPGAAKDFILGATRSDTGVNRLSFFTGSPDTSLNGGTAINTGQWVHVAATRNGTTGQMRIYVNGQPDGAAVGSTGLLLANDRINIGGNTGDGRYFNGDIDDVRIYTRVLGDAEIATLSAQTAPREDYATWAARTMPALSAAARAANADPDGDGRLNFAEFALSLNPLAADAAPQAVTRGADGALRFTFRRRLDGGDIGYTVLLSADLQTWRPAGGELLLESLVRPTGQSYETVTMRLANPGPEFATRAFFTLEAVSLAP